MHRMTRLAGPGEVKAPFDGTTFQLAGDSVTTVTERGERFMRIRNAKGESTYKVTMVIGGRVREDYAGEEIHSPGEARVLPLSWLLFSKSWRYKGYSVMVHERDRLDAGASWRQTCIFCHNTAPYLATVYDDLAPGAPSYQGSVSDNLLPEARTWRFAVRDPGELAGAVRTEVGRIGPSPPRGDDLDRLLRSAAKATSKHFEAKHLVELGIGCEACHLGSKAHTKDPRVLPSLEPSGAGFSLGPSSAAGGASRAAWINRTCARCHTVLFSRYAHTWEGGERRIRSAGNGANAGGSHINSGEARDFLLGGCSNALSCTTCHDPHAGSSRARYDELATTKGNRTCTPCHQKYESTEGLRAHTHHDPTGAGSACLSCHMPKKNLGLGYELTRYHRIGSPTDEARVLGDRPLECTLCHEDWTVLRTISTMERLWNKRYDRTLVHDLYPELGKGVLEQTVRLGKPHEQAVAAVLLSGKAPAQELAVLAPMLSHPYPLVRYFVAASLEARFREKLGFDLHGKPEDVAPAYAAWLAKRETPPAK